MQRQDFNLAAPFHASARANPDRPALWCGGATLSYGELSAMASSIAGFVAPVLRNRRVGVLGTRSFEAYAGILGAAMAGATYVPLNLKWPEERLAALLAMLDLDALVADVNGARMLTPKVLAAAPSRIAVADAVDRLPEAPGRDVTRIGDIADRPLAEPVAVGPDHMGYVIFTSGTTGMPKGVMISAGSLASYLDSTRGWTAFTPADRIAETCDVTFDLTVHNAFLAFEAGAPLYLMSQLEMLAPARFIRANAITVWMSVPTVIATMRKTGQLKPGMFPSLRQSVFCGEPLPVAAAQAWAAAAPNGVVENIYGPTECTVICLRQRLTDPPVVTAGREIVAIGDPYDTMEVAILDARQQPVPDGEPGEIALSGPQVGIGYFGSPEQTADRFRVIEGRRWYLTGDLGRRDENGIFHHLGRTDNQVKVKGNRIELEEVEAHLRGAAGTDMVAVVAWPVVDGSAQGLVGFAAGTTLDGQEIARRMAATLPRYMVPGTIRVLDTLPVNVNGKIDRRALKEGLEATVSATPAARPALAPAAP